MSERANTDTSEMWRAVAEEFRAENERLREALRYILGYDVAGYAAHMRPEEVARKALGL